MKKSAILCFIVALLLVTAFAMDQDLESFPFDASTMWTVSSDNSVPTQISSPFIVPVGLTEFGKNKLDTNDFNFQVVQLDFSSLFVFSPVFFAHFLSDEFLKVSSSCCQRHRGAQAQEIFVRFSKDRCCA